MSQLQSDTDASNLGWSRLVYICIQHAGEQYTAGAMRLLFPSSSAMLTRAQTQR